MTMTTQARRDFLRQAVALGGSVFVPLSWSLRANAQPCAITRFSASSNEGKAMLTIYADAVRKMKDAAQYPEGDPRSWLFQWYTHSVRRDKSKAIELKRVYANDQKYLPTAKVTWETCQPHHGEREDFFLPWHRFYVDCFEKIIRQVSGKPCFTLPYWDYTDPQQRALPGEFRKKDDPVWGALFSADRNDGVNDGGDITKAGGLDLDLECMTSRTYSPSQGDSGFCGRLDIAPHGALHVDVGSIIGMGDVPWAAKDPIFWLHHCNIDRIWASWNKAGGSNPDDSDFLKQPFAFAAPDGSSEYLTVKDALSIPSDLYDTYLPRPPGSLPFPPHDKQKLAVALVLRADIAPAFGSKPVRLNQGKSVTVPLVGTNPTPMQRTQKDVVFSTQLRSLEPRATLRLLLDGIRSDVALSGGYSVYVHAGNPANLKGKSGGYVGQINFFGSVDMPEHGHSNKGKSASFVLSEENRALLEKSGSDEPKVTFVPTSDIAATANPVVGRVQLVGL